MTTGMQVVIECGTCGNLSKGTILPRVTQGDLFEDLGFVVSGFLDKNGNERRCPRCEASLFEHGAKVFVVCKVGRIA